MARTGVGGPSGPTALQAIPSGAPVVPGPVNPGNEAVRAFESCANTFDPTVAPGLDRPIGSRLIRRNGLAAWDKIGPDPTDWAPVGSGGGGGSFVPSDLAGLVLDLDPSAGTTVDGSDEIDAWSDQSGSNNNVVRDGTTSAGAAFVLTPAAIGGLPGLVSDPIAGSSLVSANAAPVFTPGSARTVFVVATVLHADDGCVFIAFQPSTGLSTTFALGLWNFSNAGTIFPYTDGITISQSTPLQPGTFEGEVKVYAYRFDGTGQIEFSVNGSPFSPLSGTAFASETGANGFYIGRFIGTTFQGNFKGTLGRILGYNAALEDADALRVISFLMSGYGVPTAQPIPVPGPNLTNANQTIGLDSGSAFLLPAGTLTATRTVTLDPITAVVGDMITIERQDTSANTVDVVNGGPGGGTIYTFPVSVKRYAGFVFDGTDWLLCGAIAVL